MSSTVHIIFERTKFSFIYSFNKHLLSIYYVPYTLIGITTGFQIEELIYVYILGQGREILYHRHILA